MFGPFRGQGRGRGFGRGRGMGWGRGMGYGRGFGRGYGYRNDFENMPTSRGNENLNAGTFTGTQLVNARAYVDVERCVGCGICENVCRTGAIRVIDGVAQVDVKKCIGCGDCANVCPRNAISLKSI